MRVLHLGKFFPPHPGGIERTCADLSAALAARGIVAAVLAHAEPGAHTSRTQVVADVDVTLAACHGQLLYAPVSPGFPWLLDRLIRRFRPDLLHIHMPNTSAFWALLLPSARRIPWIVHWHADIPLDSRRRGVRAAYRLYRPWEQALLRRACAVIATSVPYRDSSTALAPWHANTRVIPLGLPPADTSPSPQPLPRRGGGANSDAAATLSPLSARGRGANADAAATLSPLSPRGRGAGERGSAALWPSDGLRLLAVGRLSYYKGFDILLRALALTPDTSLVLVGHGECALPLRQLASELGIGARVTFAGHVDDDTLGGLYARAELFCLPSIERSEAFGLVLLEAMRARLPTIASDIPGSGVGFVVRNGETGLLVPPGDVAALAAALQRMATDADLRQRMGAAGERRWREEFTLDRAAERTLALYREILDKREV